MLAAGDTVSEHLVSVKQGYVLAIDTSAGTTVAVLSLGEVLAELNYLEPMTHSERIGILFLRACKQRNRYKAK